MPNRNCIDTNLSLSLSNGKPALAAELLHLLLKDLQQNHIDISKALTESRFGDALELIHKLYGASCYCGVPQLKEACKKLEAQLKEQLSMPSLCDIAAFNVAIQDLLDWQDNCDVDTLFMSGE